MDVICSHDICTGCQACRLACPKHCITMEENERGFIYPVVNQNDCIDCKVCQSVCPSLNPPSYSDKPIVVYAGWVKNQKARKYSTSGAISWALSNHFLADGNAFCGVIWEDNSAKHLVSRDIKDIKKFQGSKYSHSDVRDCYQEIKQLLLSGVKVLFSGTPCQVAALRNYLKKEYANLYTVDLVCHGVPSKRILRDRISRIETDNGKKVIEMRFRDKQPDQLHTCCKYTFEDGTSVSHKYSEDFFSRSFVDNYALRENCFNCQYSRKERVSDMTIADFWGFQPRSLRLLNYEQGVSIIIVNNQKGAELLDTIKNDIVVEKHEIDECANRNLHQPQQKPEKYEDYWKDYEDSSITREVIHKKYLTNVVIPKATFKKKIRIFAKAMLPQSLMNQVRRILRTIGRNA